MEGTQEIVSLFLFSFYQDIIDDGTQIPPLVGNDGTQVTRIIMIFADSCLRLRNKMSGLRPFTTILYTLSTKISGLCPFIIPTNLVKLTTLWPENQ